MTTRRPPDYKPASMRYFRERLRDWTFASWRNLAQLFVFLVPKSKPQKLQRPKFEPPSGTRDFYPTDMRLRDWLFGQWRDCARLFSFQEYDAPILENVDLYKRKGGEEIVEQMYGFTDKEGNEVSLRPEMTPSLARMVLNLTNLRSGRVRGALPFKWFSIPQCWRFETTQRGRRREHYQWNMDIVGVKQIYAEAELLAVVTTFLRRVNLSPKEICIKVNSRVVLEEVLGKYGITKNTITASTDKLDKESLSRNCSLLAWKDVLGTWLRFYR